MSHSSFNHLLEDEGQWVWVAFWHAPCKTCGITRPDTYECSPEDYRACGYRWPQNADV